MKKIFTKTGFIVFLTVLYGTLSEGVLMFAHPGREIENGEERIVNEVFLPIEEVDITIEEPRDSLLRDDYRTIEENNLINETEDASIEIEWPQYEDWDVVTIEGKLKMAGLPLTPSVKIFMQRDSLVDISIRAPFVGEAGRLIMNCDSVLIVNKMGKKYWSTGAIKGEGNLPLGEAGRELLEIGLKGVQDLLLGRFFLPGFDINEVDLNELLDVYETEDANRYNVVPKGAAEIEGVKYGFVVDDRFEPIMLMVLPGNQDDTEIDIVYSEKLKGYDIQAVFQQGTKSMEAILELKEPVWKGTAPKGIDLGKKYTRVYDLMRVM